MERNSRLTQRTQMILLPGCEEHPNNGASPTPQFEKGFELY
jgi:hypothetical protein